MTTRSLILLPHEVRAALDGRLGLVVRPVKPQPTMIQDMAEPEGYDMVPSWDGETELHMSKCPLGVPGDRLVCKETWAWSGDASILAPERIARGEAWFSVDSILTSEAIRWRSPATMPAWASRIALEVVGVRCVLVDRLYESEAERTGIGPELVPPDGGGSPHKEGLRTFWESKYGSRYPWETSRAWAAEVRRVEA